MRLHLPGPVRSGPRVPSGAAMATPPTPRHVLAIDNDQSVLALFRTLLEEAGYRVSTRAYVDKEMAEIKALAPDLIVLDYMWSDEDAGWSLLQMLRMDRETAVVPIVLCTGAVREIEALQGHLEEMG